ncbi:MAG: UvrD-helicase domain-containing protein [Spirochaetales bacterium]|nr:UvrD-helicase domain-containing protein [Spirochaetales bacterium]
MSKKTQKPPEDLQAVKARLNPQQRDAVDTIDGPLLIVAGAGSGKTGVVTTRIAQMLEQGIPQSAILALTFTNKAAREMEGRVKSLTGRKLSNLTVSTFHAFGVRILRDRSAVLGYRPNFTIYDSSDKLSCLREASRELKLTHEPAELNALAALFSDIKTQRQPWDSAIDVHRPLYEEYHELMKLHNAVDFDDLIIRPLQIFEEHPDILAEYRARYRYIMVDEFQDTSRIQYRFVKHMAFTHRNLCCVGDDDQSIYSWRGADYTNILNFEKDFSELKEIKLERNYRSTGTILKAANAVIANNTDRKDKELWTDDGHEEMTLRLASPENETEEGTFIAETIGALRATEGLAYDQVGILVRTNALTKGIEDALLAHNLPYTMSGGTSFFQRPEIKDMIGYLRVIDNPDDDVNLLRIVNTPRRGVGKTTLETIVNLSRQKGCSLYSAICQIVFDGAGVSEKIRGGLAEFVDLIEKYRDLFETEEGAKSALAGTFNELLEEVNYWGHLVQEFRNNEKIAKWRYENIQHFSEFLARWESNPDNLEPTLTRWLNRITLNARDELDDAEAGKVNLMTIHASKGLEFDVVFLAGVEDGIVPHAKSVEEDPKSMEEERRLFYVAITRARKKLYISSCQTRRIRLETIACIPSPFLEEIPQDLMENAEDDDPVSHGDDVSSFFSNMPWK